MAEDQTPTEGLTPEQLAAVLQVIKDRVDEAYYAGRADLLDDLNTHNAANPRRPITQTTVYFDGIGNVAKVTLPQSRGKWVVTDPKAFAASVEEFAPDSITVETVIKVNPNVEKAILKGLKTAPLGEGDAEVPVRIDKETGEPTPVAGVEYVPGSNPADAATKFSMTWAKPDDPRDKSFKEKLLEWAIAGGQATDVLLDVEQQPALEAAPETVDAEIVDEDAA